MTSGSTPPNSPRSEAEYARKLALALLSTLETKGFLTKADVDTILAVAHRAALQADTAAADEGAGEPPPAETIRAESASAGAARPQAAPAREPAPPASGSVLTAPIEVKRPLGPAVLGTRWVKPEAVTPTGRSETGDLGREPGQERGHETGHEPGAVTLTGQGKSESRNRPLAPAIVTGGRRREDRPTPPVEPAEADPAQTPPDRVEAQAEPAAPKNQEQPSGVKEPAPVVIDFDLD